MSDIRLVPIDGERVYESFTVIQEITTQFKASLPYRDALAEVVSVIGWWLDQAPEFNTTVVAGAILRGLGIPEDVEA